MNEQNESIIWPIFSAMIILCLLGYIVFVIYKNIQKNPAISVVTPINFDVTTWKPYTIPEANLSFKAPPEMEVTFKTEKDAVTLEPYVVTLYIQKNAYQLYGIYQINSDYTNDSLASFKGELQPDSIKDATISGYPALVGQMAGERNRFVTYIQTEKGIFSFLTSEPTVENKQLTDKILETFIFTIKKP